MNYKKYEKIKKKRENELKCGKCGFCCTKFRENEVSAYVGASIYNFEFKNLIIDPRIKKHATFVSTQIKNINRDLIIVSYINTNEKGACVLYNSKEKRCSVYDNRPAVCKTYPICHLPLYSNKIIIDDFCKKNQKSNIKSILKHIEKNKGIYLELVQEKIIIEEFEKFLIENQDFIEKDKKTNLNFLTIQQLFGEPEKFTKNDNILIKIREINKKIKNFNILLIYMNIIPVDTQIWLNQLQSLAISRKYNTETFFKQFD